MSDTSEEVIISKYAELEISVKFVDNNNSWRGSDSSTSVQVTKFDLPDSAVEFYRNMGQSQWRKELLSGDAESVIKSAFERVAKLATEQFLAVLEARSDGLGGIPPKPQESDYEKEWS